MNRTRTAILLVGAVLLGAVSATFAQQGIVPPLHTSGHQIIDGAGHTVRLTSANWYGFDQKEFVAGGLDHAPLDTIIQQIEAIGVNSVRLPWANETIEHNPRIADYAVKANPQLRGKRALDVMDAVVAALARAHIMVILDNHVSRADWCCSETDGNGLWYNTEYPETRWLADWQTIVRRYQHKPWVVGADLRNELRSGAQWGGSDPKLDWHAAAERCGNTILAVNSKLLIMVESPQYSTDFTGFAKLPLVLKVPHRVVYSPHAYASAEHRFQSYDELRRAYDARAGYLLQIEPTVPLWVGEFGSCQTLDCGDNSQWLRWFIRYLEEQDLGWSYWPLNGTQSSGEGRKYDSLETYGLLTTDYQHIAAPKIVELLRGVGASARKAPIK